MTPTRRDLHFSLPRECARHWHVQGPFVTHFANAMSLFFPHGERYFIHTVRHYRDQITQPELKDAVTAFIGQEAMHGREHEAYNRLLAEAGLPSEEIEAHVAQVFALLKKWLPASAQLSATIAQEHFTAIVAELLLTNPRVIAGADRHLRALWRWHALEEIEHKAVAFDVYEKAVGRDAKAYALRVSGLVLTTAVFLGLVLYYQQRLLKADKRVKRWQGLDSFLTFLLVSPGFVPRLARPWLSYFRRDFHPWDHDNRHLLKEMQLLVDEVEYAARPEALPAPA
jgi:uncharacterized protein